MDTIQNLFYGNIHPFEREIPKDSERDRLSKQLRQSEAKLKETLDERETELFEKFKTSAEQECCICECEGFVNGFKLGIRLMTDSLK